MVELTVTRRTLIARLPGEIDEHICKAVRGELDAAINGRIFDRMIFDFTDVTFMDSAGIGMLIGRYKLLCAAKKSCFIFGVTSTVDKILGMTGIYEIIPKVSKKEVEQVTGTSR